MSRPPASQTDRSPRHPRWREVDDVQWNDWRWQLRNRITDLGQLESIVELTEEERRGARDCAFAFAITPYYASLMGDAECGVRRQAVPLADEAIRVPWDLEDPLAEDEHSPVDILSHRYPDRALLYVTHTCPVYCRHCTRSRKVGDANSAPDRSALDEAFSYLGRTPAIRDVLVSGGDPLSLSDDRLIDILTRLRSIESVEVIRLCTRNPVTLPQRITPELVERLRALHPIYVSTHFNHPGECTPEAAYALGLLADAGCSIGNQMVLLRGINDDADTVERLNRWLVRNRCRPYYMFQCDAVAGTAHLRTPLAVGLGILDQLRGRLSGLAIPQFVVDLPGGGGKISLSPDRLVRREGSRLTFRDHRGQEFEFVDQPAEAAAGNLVRLSVL